MCILCLMIDISVPFPPRSSKGLLSFEYLLLLSAFRRRALKKIKNYSIQHDFHSILYIHPVFLTKLGTTPLHDDLLPHRKKKGNLRKDRIGGQSFQLSSTIFFSTGGVCA